ncbi:hypothetical protein Tco_0261795 [Tanacetum coccineum]
MESIFCICFLSMQTSTLLLNVFRFKNTHGECELTPFQDLLQVVSCLHAGIGLHELELMEIIGGSRRLVDTKFVVLVRGHSDIPLPISLPMVPLTVSSPVATPATAETEGFLTKLGAQVEMQGGLISDHAVGAVTEEIFYQRYRFRILEYEQERVAVTLERITKKRTKNKAKTTKPDSEWKRL